MSESTPFIKYVCEKMLPAWNLIGGNDQQDLRLFKVCAKMVGFCGKFDEPSPKIDAILNVLLVTNRYYTQPYHE